MKKMLLVALTTAMTIGLAGCPPKAVLDVYGWVVDSANKTVTEGWQNDNDDIDVPTGGAAILSFSSEQKDVEFISGTVKLRGGGKTETQNLTAEATKHCNGCEAAGLVMVGIVSTIFVDAIDNGDGGQDNGNGEDREGFEVTIEMLAAVDSVDVEIETNIGWWNATLWNSGGNPDEGETPTEGEAGQFKLTTAVVGQGTVTGAGMYDAGERVTLTATPANGWSFSQWLVNGSSAGTTTNPVAEVSLGTTTAGADVSVICVFTQTGTVVEGEGETPINPGNAAVAFTSSGNNLSATVNTDWLSVIGTKPSGITHVKLFLYYPSENGYVSSPWESIVDVATNGNVTISIPSTAVRTNTSGQAIARIAMEVRNGSSSAWVDIGKTISTFNGTATPINNGAWQKTL